MAADRQALLARVATRVHKVQPQRFADPGLDHRRLGVAGFCARTVRCHARLTARALLVRAERGGVVEVGVAVAEPDARAAAIARPQRLGLVVDRLHAVVVGLFGAAQIGHRKTALHRTHCILHHEHVVTVAPAGGADLARHAAGVGALVVLAHLRVLRADHQRTDQSVGRVLDGVAKAAQRQRAELDRHVANHCVVAAAGSLQIGRRPHVGVGAAFVGFRGELALRRTAGCDQAALPGHGVGRACSPQRSAVQAGVAAVGLHRVLRDARRRQAHAVRHPELVQVKAVGDHRQEVVVRVFFVESGAHVGHRRDLRQVVAQLHRDALTSCGAQHERLDGPAAVELGLHLPEHRAVRGFLLDATPLEATLPGDLARELVAARFAVEHIDHRMRIADAVTLAVDQPAPEGRRAASGQIAGPHRTHLEAGHADRLRVWARLLAHTGHAVADLLARRWRRHGVGQRAAAGTGNVGHPLGRPASHRLPGGQRERRAGAPRVGLVSPQHAPHAVPQLVDRRAEVQVVAMRHVELRHAHVELEMLRDADRLRVREARVERIGQAVPLHAVHREHVLRFLRALDQSYLHRVAFARGQDRCGRVAEHAPRFAHRGGRLVHAGGVAPAEVVELDVVRGCRNGGAMCDTHTRRREWRRRCR